MSDEDDILDELTEEGLLDESNEQDMADDWAAAMEEQELEEQTTDSAADDDLMESPELESLVDESGPTDFDAENPDLEVILDIPVSISMVVGSTQISIRNLLQLNQGSVIELDRLAGEPLDVLVNNTLVAHGEVVVVNEKFGIRLTDVISAAERIRKLA